MTAIDPVTRTADPGASLADWLRERTPARLFTGRAGSSYPTATLLSLRADHAAARDAVTAPLELDDPQWKPLGLLPADTCAPSRHEYLRRPDLGRRLSHASRTLLAERCRTGLDVQLAIGDGLSAMAVHRQVPALLPLLTAGCARLGWSTGRPIAIRQCRVGVMNDIGELLRPTVVILLIGERPGLATAESLSAYLAHRPRAGHTDAHRNLISNIHADGVPLPEAADRILSLAAALRAAGRSGVDVKEPTEPFSFRVGAGEAPVAAAPEAVDQC